MTLKTKYSYFFWITILLLIVACSTKKDKLINRQFQALNTKFNVLYNGNIALAKGIVSLKSQYNDDFWKTLPIERMQISDLEQLPGTKSKNADFVLAEEKATKAIQKRSMNIDGKEKNPQIDEAHLLLGKARYYDQRFVPALEAFNYILYKYPSSDKIYEAKIWREKTNMRLDNDALAIKNLRILLKEIKFKDQIFADANATLGQAFLNMNEKDSAVAKIKLALKFTKSTEEKARYRFILGQMYESLQHQDSAFAMYQSVIDMKRKSPKPYVIHAEAQQLLQFDFDKADTTIVLKKYKKLLEDRENRPFLDNLNHQLALFYDYQKNTKRATFFYNQSLRRNSTDQYLVASNYRNLGKIYFDKAKYQDAGKYYDSTLVRLTPRTREYNTIKKKRENLNDVIKYEGIAQQNDSILSVVALSKNDQISFYQTYIEKLKKADDQKAKLAKIAKEKADRIANDNNNDNNIVGVDSGLPDKFSQKQVANFSKDMAASQPNFGPKGNAANSSDFYFYNPQTVAYGKLEFKKKWGNRALKNNWRLSSDASKDTEPSKENDKENDVSATATTVIEPKYTADFYIKKLPTDAKIIASLRKERDFAYYQLGIIYKEKFKEYQLSASKLEQLLSNKPDERLVLPSLYNLFKVYEIINKSKADAMKTRIIAEYPTSRYAQILSNPDSADKQAADSPEGTYKSLYAIYESGKMFEVLDKTTAAIDQFAGEEIVPKMELLKATVIGKLQGLAAYKKALNFVALTYPNVEQGKTSEKMLAENVPQMERLKFYEDKPSSWKIFYLFETKDSILTKPLIEKIKKFIGDRQFIKIKYGIDNYNMTQSFVMIHNIKDEQIAKDIVSILKNYKEYEVPETLTVISNENYKIVQIKKNLDEYLIAPKANAADKPIVPLQNTPSQSIPVPSPKQPATPSQAPRNLRMPPSSGAVPSIQADPRPPR